MTQPRNNRRPSQETELSQAVSLCAENERFIEEMLEIYRNTDRIGDNAGNVCLGGGACCRFDLFDHRLYATVGELAILLRTDPPRPERTEQNRCPYQNGPRCLARENRPLGCRVFFCRERPGAAETDAYEAAHRQIRRLHADHDLSYAYVELISALKILHQFCR